MKRAATIAVLIWLVFLAACATVIWHSRFTADMSAFLPKHPTREQQLLVDQIKEGALSRMLLIGIEGADAAGRARLSRSLAARMRAGGDFVSVQNGDDQALEQDRKILFAYRYLLSPAVTPQRFTEEGLHQAIGDSIDLLSSPAGMLLKKILPRDPSGEMMELLGGLDGDGGPSNLAGVWSSHDGRRAILTAQMQAAGSDTDRQEIAIDRLHREFATAAGELQLADARLLLSGNPVFSVASRTTIRSEVKRLSILGTLAIVCLLLLVYRSVTALVLGLLPVLSGVLAGIAAVSLGFGSVHGITIGFGTTLIGEAVDYTIYYFVQSAAPSVRPWSERFWPTIRLGVLTSICGFASLLFSGFPGLAQLGLYSIAGLTTAAVVTRWVLPYLHPAGLRIPQSAALGNALVRYVAALPRLRGVAILLTLAAAAVLVAKHDQLWNSTLAGLSPIPAEAQAIHGKLRSDLGAPDMRYLIVVTTPQQETTLAATEAIAAQLQTLVQAKRIAGFTSPTRYLPSAATQQVRQAALPPRQELESRLRAALVGLPIALERLTPFLDDVDQARHLPLLDRETLRGSGSGLAVDSLLLQQSGSWTALIPLRATGDDNAGLPDVIHRALADADAAGALFVDLLAESNRLYSDYLDQAIRLSLAGFLAIVLLLAVTLRSLPRLLRALAPLVAAVALVIAGLALAGESLTLLHLVGMLLIVAVGSNYALFFDQGADGSATEPATLSSLLIANVATLIGFGILAFSQVPVLHAIGITVGPGAVLALLLSAMLNVKMHFRSAR